MENKGINLKVTIRPAVVIYMGKTKLGCIKFKDLEDTGKFLKRLRKAIEQIINDFNDKKENDSEIL